MIFYRGFDLQYGFFTNNTFLWVSDSFAIASEYGDSVKSCKIDFSKLKFADLVVLETICSKLDYDYIEAIYNPSEDFVKEIKKSGFNAYSIEPCDYSYCCILETSLIHSISVSLANPEKEQQVFLQSLARSQRSNPFVKVLNDNIPLLLLLQTIKLINFNGGKGISRQELPILLFWKDNDAVALYDTIIELRKKHGFNPSDEVIIDIYINKIMKGKYKKFEAKSIMQDYTDEFIRKMRMSGLISIRGAGRFIDINHNEDNKVDYILNNYSDYKHYEDEYEYFKYMSKIDTELIAQKSETVTQEETNDLLSEWLKTYNWETIKLEMKNLANRKPSKDSVLKLLAAPVRLEFLTALAIKSRMKKVIVKPNYASDDTGLPTSTAGGNKGDIECFENGNGILVEVTMSEGRTQTMMEIWPIQRHLAEFISENNFSAQCIFTAPSIFADSKDQIEWVKDRKNLIIRDYPIEKFTEYLETEKTLYK